MPYLTLDPDLAEIQPTVDLGQGPDEAAAHPLGKSLANMRARIVRELGNRTDLIPPAIDPSPIDEWINDAYLDFFTALKLPESRRSYEQTLIPEQAMYLLPTGVGAIRAVSVTDPNLADTGATLEKIDLASFRKLPIRSGDPEVWFRERNLLVFWPTPDREFPISVDVDVQPAPLADDADYPVLDDKWHEALFKAAKGRAWEAIQNDAKAALAESGTQRLVQRRNDQDADDRGSEYPSLRPITSRRELMNLRRNPRRIEPGE